MISRDGDRGTNALVSHDARDSAGACVSCVLAARQTDQCKRRLFFLRSLRGQDRNESLTSYDYRQGGKRRERERERNSSAVTPAINQYFITLYLPNDDN